VLREQAVLEVGGRRTDDWFMAMKQAAKPGARIFRR
jgi:hypothetical protein